MIIAISAGRDASPELRARVALDREGIREILRKPRPGIGELLVLSTCHRTELYATAEGAESDAVHAAAGLLPGLQPSDHAELAVLRGAEAVRHLFRVACGLDSLVIGEPQVQGQVREAYTLARDEGAAGPTLSNVLARALKLGRGVRRTTPLGAPGWSIGALAARMLDERLGGLAGRTGTVVGAGDAAADAARALRRYGPNLVVVGRSVDATERLARAVAAETRPMAGMTEALRESAFAVVAVGGGSIASSSIPPRDGSAPLLVVDLSVPPAVSVPGRRDVDVRTIDDLPVPARPELGAAIDAAERAVEEAVDAWTRWVDDPTAGRDVGRFRAQVEALVRREVAATLSRMQVSPEQGERIAALAMRVTNKLLHGPSIALRDADAETRRTILELFELEP